MTRRRLALTLATAVIAGGVALAACPDGYYCANYTPAGDPICEPW